MTKTQSDFGSHTRLYEEETEMNEISENFRNYVTHKSIGFIIYTNRNAPRFPQPYATK